MAPRIILYVLIMIFMLPFKAGADAARIISLYPGHTDNIVALGEEKKLVGISQSDDDDMLPQLKRFSAKSSAEEILALKPDLVLTRSLAERQNPQQRRVLERAGVRVVSLDPPQWDDFAAYLREIASLIGCDPEAAEKKLKNIRGAIAAESSARSKGRHPAVFVEATAKELHTCSPGSWAAKLIELAGGRNAAADAEAIRSGSAIAPYGLERIMKAASAGRIDVYLVQRGAMNATDMKALAARQWYPALKGIKTAVVPEKELSRPSLLGLEAAGKRLIKIFYGE